MCTSKDIHGSATPAALLTCEEGQIVEGDLSRLAILKDLGIEAVSEMERLGIVVDVSYLSDEVLRPLGAFVGLNFFILSQTGKKTILLIWSDM
ncbi:MAG: hypothetical protein WBI82_10075 [Sphaerochaeta sp.]